MAEGAVQNLAETQEVCTLERSILLCYFTINFVIIPTISNYKLALQLRWSWKFIIM